MRLVVAITGSSGAIYGVNFLEACRKLDIETDLIITRDGEKLISLELGKTAKEVRKLATRSYAPDEMTAPIASGSFRTDGMVIVPCSMKTLAAVAGGIAFNLVTRAADVTLKQNRPLVLVPRETPLNLIHLENMTKLKRAGATILPAAPAYYQRPKTIFDLADFISGRILEILGVKHNLYKPWGGLK